MNNNILKRCIIYLKFMITLKNVSVLKNLRHITVLDIGKIHMQLYRVRQYHIFQNNITLKVISVKMFYYTKNCKYMCNAFYVTKFKF